MANYKNEQLQTKIDKLQCKYEDIVIPDRKLNDIKNKFGELSQKWLKLVIDYLNRDKYLLVQSIVKKLNQSNSVETIAYLDWALSRIDGLIITLWSNIKPDKKLEEDID